ncbi:hypothetical protein [uncultured Algoriphagus sp.]|uniref:hypothetical protein n=1 Tax=uncultured Algoriphagus sp. TaxID=417365 RepID=UPI0025889148|nr:hypothetical protein [uncultured Algoriphagus sp.]
MKPPSLSKSKPFTRQLFNPRLGVIPIGVREFNPFRVGPQPWFLIRSTPGFTGGYSEVQSFQDLIDDHKISLKSGLFFYLHDLHLSVDLAFDYAEFVIPPSLSFGVCNSIQVSSTSLNRRAHRDMLPRG